MVGAVVDSAGLDRCAEVARPLLQHEQALVGQLTGLQATACWTPLVLKEVGVAEIPTDLISVAVALTCHVVAFKILRRNRA